MDQRACTWQLGRDRLKNHGARFGNRESLVLVERQAVWDALDERLGYTVVPSRRKKKRLRCGRTD
jgi:hypothetical protein